MIGELKSAGFLTQLMLRKISERSGQKRKEEEAEGKERDEEWKDRRKEGKEKEGEGEEEGMGGRKGRRGSKGRRGAPLLPFSLSLLFPSSSPFLPPLLPFLL